MDKATIRRWVLDILRDEPQTHIHAIEARIRQKTEAYGKSDALLLQEIVWELLVRGVLAPGKNSLNLQLPFVHLTDFGAACLDDDLHLLPDPERYMVLLREGIGPRIGEAVFRGVHEALLCYLDGHEAAALVLLGVSVESLFLDLEKQAIHGLAAAEDRRSTKRRIARAPLGSERRFSLLVGAIRSTNMRDALPSHEPALLEMLALLRRVRTDGGSPTIVTIDRPTVHAALLSMPGILRAVDALLAIAPS